MQVSPIDASEAAFPLASYPFQIVLPARFGDLAPGGAIEHIGMARNYEDARGALMQHVADQAGISREALHSFIVRAVNEHWAGVSYPGSITVGAATIALGSSSFTVEMASFQDGVCVGRSRALAVSIGADHAPAPLTDAVRAAWLASFSERPGFRAPPKPAPERRQQSSYPHALTLTTRFSDSDAIGHLNNVSLLRYCDEGRAAVLVDQGVDPESLGTVVRADISYLQEVQMFRPLTIASAIRGLEHGQLRLEQALFQDGACVVVCDSRVSIDAELAQRLKDVR